MSYSDSPHMSSSSLPLPYRPYDPQPSYHFLPQDKYFDDQHDMYNPSPPTYDDSLPLQPTLPRWSSSSFDYTPPAACPPWTSSFPSPAPYPAPRLSPPPQRLSQEQQHQASLNARRLTLAGSLDPETGIFYRTPEHPRLRTAQACEKCRARKAKCTGDCPCGRCASRGLVCEYAKEGRDLDLPHTSSSANSTSNQAYSPASTDEGKTPPMGRPRLELDRWDGVVYPGPSSAPPATRYEYLPPPQSSSARDEHGFVSSPHTNTSDESPPTPGGEQHTLPPPPSLYPSPSDERFREHQSQQMYRDDPHAHTRDYAQHQHNLSYQREDLDSVVGVNVNVVGP
ncbi:hypothetical protein BDQ17DRAFT_1374044 [Cyathus striatus]|nr:hypothetical protein BDQ17DRAFT_1374044 [Cyathus striatus]